MVQCDMTEQDMPFTVDLWWRDRIDCVLARSMNQLIAAAAYERAIQCYPGREITLRMRMRVIRATRVES